MKKATVGLLSLLLAVCLFVLPVQAQAAETSGVWEYTLSMGDVIISGYNGTATNIVIPEMIDGRKVVGIKSGTFKDFYNLVSVTLPDTLEQIGSSAFQNCVKLTSITLPEKLETVGAWAFENCEALGKITVKSKNLSNFSSSSTFENAGKEVDGIEVVFTDTVTRIPANMFDCDGSAYARVKSVTVGSAVEEIGSYAFCNCYDLWLITLSQSLKLESIGNGAFQNCVELTSIVFPEELETVGAWAFENCESLRYITVKSKNLANFSSSSTFENAGKETDGIEVVFTNTVTRIPAHMFDSDGDGYARVKSVTVGSAVAEIGNYAFDGCYDLQTVTIPQNSALETIGNGAFGECVELTSIVFPEELETVGAWAFENCEALKKITVKSKKLSDFSNSYTFKNAGKETDGIEVVFTDTVTRIPAYMFVSNSDSEYARVNSVTMASEVEEIGYAAFRDCYDLCDVYYGGTKAQWNAIDIGDWNEDLTNANIHYASPDETDPSGPSKPEVPECEKDDNCVLAQFKDVIIADWYHDGVHFCVEEGIMNGMGNGTFAPNDATTRAQLVIMLYRLEGEPSIEGMTEPFTDVAETDWFYEPIVWAYNTKVVNGMTETTFAPNTNVSREQVATILYRYLDTPAGTGDLSGYPDVYKVQSYAKDALIWAVGEGLINGVKQTNGTSLLDPAGNATRAQIATILMRYLTA